MFIRAALLLLVMTMGLGGGTALAAQDAKVRADSTPIYAEPFESSLVVSRVDRGTLVRVSERTRAGFYKVLLPGGRFGWINARDIVADTATTDLKAAGISNSEVVSRTGASSRIMARAFYRMHYLQPTALAELAGATAKFSGGGSGLGGELGYKFDSDWGISAQLESFSYSKTETTGSYSADGLMMAVVGDYLLWFRPPFRVFLGFGGGIANGATVGFKTSSSSETSQAFLAPQAFARAVVSWSLTQQIAVIAEGGYRYLGKSDVIVGSSTIVAALSSAFAGVGAQVEF